jgi:tetratricopeptide (TPR) repeat protein
MPRSFPAVGAALAGLSFVALASAKESSPVTMDTVWSYAASNQPLEAQAALGEVETVDERTQALAEAVLAMARPPLSESDWAKIEPQLAQLAQGDDDIAAQALYLQARMHQVQKAEPDYARAEALFDALARRWPESHWTQLGYVKLGLTKLFAGDDATPPRARLATAEALLAKVTEPPLRRDLQLQIGWAALEYDLPLDEVLPHLIAADAVGGLMGITPEDLLIQIGELSFRAGHLGQAQHYLERLLAEFPTSTRNYNVRQRLAEIRQALAAPGGGA